MCSASSPGATADHAAVAALLAAVRRWVAGRRALHGPLSFTINHEVGALIEPASRPPMLRMPRTGRWRTWYDSLADRT